MRRILSIIVLCTTAASAYAADMPKLTPIQQHVMQEGGTEPAFNNEYWNLKDDGIYVDVISGEPLFSSTDKYDSGTGWPSFTKPISDHAITMKPDSSHGMNRTEVKSKSGAHLGHLFDDGPKDKGGKRYCINSASLRFVPKADLAKEGYGQYLPLFGEKAVDTKPAAMPTTEARLLAVYFYADWCPNCKILSPKLSEAREKGELDRKDILFITLNLTNKASIHQSLMLAQALGLGDYLKQQGSGTGYVAVLNPNTHKEIARIEKDASPSDIFQRMETAMAGR